MAQNLPLIWGFALEAVLISTVKDLPEFNIETHGLCIHIIFHNVQLPKLQIL
jgi:hypothetical protein